MKNLLLIGHPNTGKSSLFSELSGLDTLIANRPGVTIEGKKAPIKKMPFWTVEDLPGLYYLAAHAQGCSVDHQLSAHRLKNLHPEDLIVNVIDHRSLRSQLHLTLELIELGRPMILVLTFNAEPRYRQALEQWLGIATCLSADLLDFLGNSPWRRSCGTSQSLKNTEHSLPIWLKEMEKSCPDFQDTETSLSSQRYALIDAFLDRHHFKTQPQMGWNERLDAILLDRYLGLPIFFMVMYALFSVTVFAGESVESLCDQGFEMYSYHVAQMTSPFLQLVFHSIGLGLTATFAFAPSLFVLYLFLGFLEQSGYMQRASFVVDRLMQTLHLPGQSFVSIIVGFGCNVPAIMSARTLSHPIDRLQTMLMSPFMSCSARLAIFTVFAQAFFGAKAHHAIFGLYCLGFVVAMITGLVIRFLFRHTERSDLVMPYVSYQWPLWSLLAKSALNRVWEFISKALVWIVPSIILMEIWIKTFGLPSASWTLSLVKIFEPIGMGQENILAILSLFSGLIAKEVLLGTLQGASHQATVSSLGSLFATPQSAMSYLIFVLLYFPCVSVTIAIAQEASPFWALFSAFWSTSLAYATAFLYFQWSAGSASIFLKVWWTLLCLLYFIGVIFLLKVLVKADTKGPQIKFRLKKPAYY